MHALLTKSPLFPGEERELGDVLAAVPYAWPTGYELETAREASGLESPPPAPVGAAVLLAADTASGRGEVWFLLPPQLSSLRGRIVGFRAGADAAWRRARLQVPRSLPVIWRSVERATQGRPKAAFLGAVWPEAASDGTACTRKPSPFLDGASFGLPFALALASRILGLAIPDDLAATGALESNGNVGRVDGIQIKTRALTAVCPRVKRLLVPEASAEDARLAAKQAAPSASPELEVIPVTTLAEAIEIAFPNPDSWPRALFPRSANSPDAAEGLVAQSLDRASREDRSDLVEALFYLALGPKRAVPYWPPIARAAGDMLAASPDLEPAERRRLELAQAIALRHSHNRGPFGVATKLIADPAWLAATPEPWRTELLAHLVQQAADAPCEPYDVERLRAFVLPYLPESTLDAFPAHLKLSGALGRLASVTGRLPEALRRAREATQGWIRRYAASECSHPLSEWFRLAGAEENAAELRAAEAAERRVKIIGGLDNPTSRDFVEYAKGRAYVALGRRDGAALLLQPLAERERSLKEHRAGALRLLASICQSSADQAEPDQAEADQAGVSRAGSGSEAGRCRSELKRLAEAKGHVPARRNLILLAVEDAIRGDDRLAATAALEDLRDLQPGPVGHLMRAAARLGESPPAYVLRLFPY